MLHINDSQRKWEISIYPILTVQCRFKSNLYFWVFLLPGLVTLLNTMLEIFVGFLVRHCVPPVFVRPLPNTKNRPTDYTCSYLDLLPHPLLLLPRGNGRTYYTGPYYIATPPAAPSPLVTDGHTVPAAQVRILTK